MPIVSFTTSGALRKSALRQANKRLVLESIRRSPGISRAEIARSTGFSRTSVTFVVNRLIRERLVTEEKVENGTQAGRPPTALQLNARALMAIGVEISKPKSGAVLVDLNGCVVDRRSVEWQSRPERFLANIGLAISELGGSCKARQLLGAGISIPGTIDKAEGRVIGAEALGWFNVEAGRLLRRQTELPLFFENDANVCALAEQWYSSLFRKSYRYFVYVRAQSGLGTGVVIDGRLLHGFSSASSEFGHTMLYADGRPCSCGNRGCWEQYASGAALARAYRELGGETGGPDKVLDDSLQIVAEARAGNQHAMKALHITASYLALGFANLVAAVNPQAIIMGEPFASAWDLIEGVVNQVLLERVPAYGRSGLRLLPSQTGAEPALRGAAALVLAHFFTRFDHTKDDSLPIGVSMVAHG